MMTRYMYDMISLGEILFLGKIRNTM